MTKVKMRKEKLEGIKSDKEMKKGGGERKRWR